MGARRVLRLTSVFEPHAATFDREAARFDPIGGMQNHTAALTRCLDRRGLRQEVLTSRLAEPAGAERVGSGAVVRRVGVRTTRLRQLWAVCAVPRVVASAVLRRADVVHAHQGEDVAVLLLGALAAALHRSPLVVTVHCSVQHTVTGSGSRLLRLVGGAVERLVLRRAAAVLVLVPRTAHALEADGLPPERVHVVPSGFDPAIFADVAGDAFPGVPHPRVGYVGRLAAQKAPHLVVEAFGAVSTDASLVVVGDGPLRPLVEDAVRRSPARDRITTHGFVAHHRVPEVLASLDLLVLPSLYEEMGSVLVEAMASGLPVVASATGGIPEVVADGETGVLVPPGDVATLAKAVDDLLADPERRRAMGAAAVQRSRDYAWPALAGRVAQVYDAVGTPGVPPT